MKQIVERLKQQLSDRYDERETKAITLWLLEEICGWTRTQILLQSDSLKPTDSQRETLEELGDKMASGIPMQYAVGYEYFCGRRFSVNKDVLIPRPETAEVINWIVDNCVDCLSTTVGNPIDNRLKTPIKIMDIGTGSGCIALTLAKDINPSTVLAVDLSTGALKTAIMNAKQLDVNNVRFMKMDILNPSYQQQVDELSTEVYTSFEDLPESYQPPFDIIVSNPPYICNREKEEMSHNVLDNEPHMALFVPDDDPLLFYRNIARYGLSQLSHGGHLFFEIHSSYGRAVCELLADLGYSEVELRQDITGRDRFVKARLLTPQS